MKKLCIIIVTLSLVAGCNRLNITATTVTVATPAPASTLASISIPVTASYWPTQEWRTSTPEQQGIDSTQLVKLLDAVAKRKLAIHSILIIRHGYLVAEVYYGPNSPTLKHELYSVTKSFTSALVGIAINKGSIDGVDRAVLDLFPDRPIDNLDTRKKAMTLEHLLTMSSGLDWPESSGSYTSTNNPYVRLMRASDWTQFVLDRPMAQAPGTLFNYNSGTSHLLSAIVQKTTGTSTLAFAQEYLLRPLGITDITWRSDPSGVAIGGSDLQMMPRDMAKFGFLYLKGGLWNGQQIVPAAWVETSTNKHIQTTESMGYGYQWWIYPDGSFAAQGLGGQYIFVRPRQDLVVVFTSWLPGAESQQPIELMDTFIVPAAKSQVSLPENQQAVAQLQARIEAARNR